MIMAKESWQRLKLSADQMILDMPYGYANGLWSLFLHILGLNNRTMQGHTCDAEFNRSFSSLDASLFCVHLSYFISRYFLWFLLLPTHALRFHILNSMRVRFFTFCHVLLIYFLLSHISYVCSQRQDNISRCNLDFVL